jgi:hypothetical protein
VSGVVVGEDAVLTVSVDAPVNEAGVDIDPTGPMPPTPSAPRRGMLVLHGSRVGRVIGRRYGDLIVEFEGRAATVDAEECRVVERGYVPRVGDRVLLGERAGTLVGDEVVIEWPNGQRSRVAREAVWPIEVGGWLAKLGRDEEIPF